MMKNISLVKCKLRFQSLNGIIYWPKVSLRLWHIVTFISLIHMKPVNNPYHFTIRRCMCHVGFPRALNGACIFDDHENQRNSLLVV